MPAIFSPTSVVIPHDLADRLANVVQQTGRSLDETVWLALLNFIEDAEDVALCDQRLADLQAGRSHTLPLEEAIRELGLEG